MNKTVFVFAGPNGSGKSSIVNVYMNNGICPEPYICPDNIVRVMKEESNDADEYDLYMAAMRRADKTRKEYVLSGKSFTFETVFSNMEKLKFLRFAKAYGFHTVVTYVTTSDPSINIRRVRRRVSEGGHDVPENKIRSRYERSMSLMAEVVAFADEAEVYDNSVDEVSPELLFKKYSDGTMYVRSALPWVSKYLYEPLTEMGYVLNEK
jgi:predicted ABC-type ATPase